MISVSYDTDSGLIALRGPRGFTQWSCSRNRAQSIADVLGVGLLLTQSGCRPIAIR